MSKISSKIEMYALSDAGLLGNCLPTMSWDEFAVAYQQHGISMKGRFGLRHRRITGFPWTRPVGSAEQFAAYVEPLLRERIMSAEDVCVTVITDLPEEKRTLQGEVFVSPWKGLTLGWSGELFSPYTCREEMRLPSGVVEHTGATARAYLETFMDPVSYEWLQELLSTYDGAVVEFSSFSCGLGRFGWNTLFWEVRNY